MKIEWISLQGTEQPSNQDAAGAHISDGWLLAAIVDGATSETPKPKLAFTLVKNILDKWKNNPTSDSKGIIDILRSSHGDMRRDFAGEKAAYALALINLTTRCATALSCGDCRVGHSIEGEIKWVTKPHTLSRFLSTIGETEIDASYEKVLTRTFNARKFQPPDVIEIETIPESDHWIMATDGCTITNNGIECTQEEDDASQLRIGASLFIGTQESNSNWYWPENSA